MPTYDRLIWPTLQALKLSGGSGTIQEIEQKVAELEHFTETQMAVPHGRGKMTEVGYRQYWSRHYLKVVGAISRSSRGVWAITEIGRGMTEADAKRIPGEVRKRLKDRESPESGPPPDGEGTSYAAQEDTEEAPPHDGQIPLGIDDQE
ncbi:MAG: winged helix-turn-helix domain-containing protein, partial [Chloroflexi bacterium]|nr:winged helix-turn-helix domain-containing protein [Chloroflexota bacterium]